MSTGLSLNISRTDQPDINKGPTLVAVSISLTLLALATVALRSYARLRILRSFGADDYVITWTMVLSLAGMGDTIAQVAYGAGRHQAYLSADTIETGLKLNYVGQVIFLWAPCFVKVSIALFLLRVTPSLTLRRVIQCAMIFILVWTLACFVTLLIQCKNLAVIWNTSVVTTCWSTEAIHSLGWASAAVSISSDIFFALIPTAMLWKLQMNRRRKWSLVGIMSLGVFASAAAIVKTVYIADYSNNTDNLWNATDLTLWTTIELNVGIIAASLPCLWPYFQILRSGSMGMTPNKQYQMHPYPTSSHAPTAGSQYLHSRTVTRITGGGKNAETNTVVANSSEERIVKVGRDMDTGIQKTTAYSISSETNSQ